jgi:hypothetical protein
MIRARMSRAHRLEYDLERAELVARHLTRIAGRIAAGFRELRVDLLELEATHEKDLEAGEPAAPSN